MVALQIQRKQILAEAKFEFQKHGERQVSMKTRFATQKARLILEIGSQAYS